MRTIHERVAVLPLLLDIGNTLQSFQINMVGYNVKIQEFHNGEVKFSIYPDGINYIPDEFKSYLENERIERRLQESQDSYIYNPFTEMVLCQDLVQVKMRFSPF